MSTQIVRPTADGTINWSSVPASAPHFQYLDEVTPNDAQFVWSLLSGDTDSYKLAVATFTPTRKPASVTVRIRAKYHISPGGIVTVTLTDGDGGTATAGVSKTLNSATPADFDLVFADGFGGSPWKRSDFSDLYLMFTKSGAGFPAVTQAYATITDSGPPRFKVDMDKDPAIEATGEPSPSMRAAADDAPSISAALLESPEFRVVMDRTPSIDAAGEG